MTEFESSPFKTMNCGEEEGRDRDEQLIESVRNHQVLYDPRHKDFKLQGKKDLLWIQIAEEIKQEVSWCKNKWKYLRDHYKQKKKELKGKSGDAAKKIKKWAYFYMLSFLDISLQDAETTGNMGPLTPSSEHDETFCEEQADESQQNETPQSSRNNKRKRSDVDSALDEALLSYMTNQDKRVKDSHYYFAMGIAEQLRGLPDQAAAYAKTQIQHVMFKVECDLSNDTVQGEDSQI